MKKVLMFVLAAALLLSAVLLSACGTEPGPASVPESSSPEETKLEEIRVYTLMGPTGMGMAKLISDGKNGKTSATYNFTIASAPDQITAEVIKGNFEVAALPVNLASVLYNKTGGKLLVAAVNTLGVLYVLENGDTIHSIEDLKGKTVYATGQAATPEYTLRHILEKNGIDPDKDLTIEYLAEHAELATKMTSGDVVLGMLPEPNVTSVLLNNKDVRIALNLTEEWKKVSETELVQGCIVVSRTFAEEHPGQLADFLREYADSVAYVKENTDEAAALIEEAGIVPKAAVARKALPNCNLAMVTGEEMKHMVSDMLGVLYAASPASVGGQLPDDAFYLK